ncbi:hypothetical protein [Halorarius halobius]|uniref:hypothetical protein n=1 Tax=Halorarius halobius TaxID=2962671 RepID=UPI0020CDB6AD|nr:hypothetical protein [Halorarius halobius]
MVRRGAVAVLVALSLGAGAGLVQVLGPAPGAAVAVLVLVAAGLLVQWRGSSGEGDVWGFTSSGERTGRYAESGGIAREEQAKAVEEIQEQAERTDRE